MVGKEGIEVRSGTIAKEKETRDREGNDIRSDDAKELQLCRRGMCPAFTIVPEQKNRGGGMR